MGIGRTAKTTLVKFLQYPAFSWAFKAITGIIHFYSRAAALERPSVKNLDYILDKANKLEDFLSDSFLQERYYEELSKYFSSRNVARKFSKKSYFALIEQISVLCRTVPEFSKMAWRPCLDHTSFRIHAREQNTGRQLNLLAWKLFRHQWISGLEAQSGCMSPDEIRSILISISKRVNLFEKEYRKEYGSLINSLKSRKQRKHEVESKNEFYESIINDIELKRVASHFLHQYIVHSQNKIFFELIDADLIIHYFKELRQNPKAAIPQWLDVIIPPGLSSAIKKIIPSTETLLNDRVVFPINNSPVLKSRTSEYHTFAVRPFHGIWTGVFSQDCLAGDPKYLSILTPARWAASLLRGTQVEFVERNDRYQGYVRNVPVLHEEEGLLHNLEVWVPMMSRPVIRMNLNTYIVPQQVSLFEQWLESWTKTESHCGQRVVVSNSRFVDNDRVKEAIFRSEALRTSGYISPAALSSPEEAILAQMALALPPVKGARKYFDGNLAVDAMLKDASTLRFLHGHSKYYSMFSGASSAVEFSRGHDA